MFSFRLQRLLGLRQEAENAKARALSAAQQTADAVRSHRDVLAELHAASRAEVNNAHAAAPRVGHLQQLGLVMRSLDDRLESADESVLAANDVVAEAHRQLAAAVRDRHVLDRLKIRHTDQWRAAEAQRDRVGMDEVALTLFARNAEARATDDAHARSRSIPPHAGSARDNDSQP